MMSKIDLVGGKSIYVTYRRNAVQPPSSFSLSLPWRYIFITSVTAFFLYTCSISLPFQLLRFDTRYFLTKIIIIF